MFKIKGSDLKEYGPVTAEQVREWIAQRRLNAESLAQAEGTTSWKPLSLFPEFSAALASTPLPPALPGMPRPDRLPSARNNSLAIWSLVCGCVGLVCCQAVSIAGIVLGTVALGELKANPLQQGRGMAIAGIVLGGLGLVMLVLLLILGVFGSLLENLWK